MSIILGASKITTRFQITMPEQVRISLNVKVGQTVIFVKENNVVTLRCEL